MTHLLLIEDDATGRELAEFNLRREGYTVDAAEEGASGLARFDPKVHDLVITDIRMPGPSGLEVLSEVKRRSPETPVLVITAFGNMELAVEAMRAGAADFIGKPFHRGQLLLAVERAMESRRLREEVQHLRIRASGVERTVVFVSEAMRHLLDTVDRVAASEASVLITGESGTGKELVARRIHVYSTRAEGPFVAVSCAAIPAELLESELFGHVKGAFTGATRDRVGRFRQAKGGTLFLDEVAELPLALQGKLLRALQERVVDVLGADQAVPVDVRVVAATNRDLRARLREGTFREDLFYRLNVVELKVPALRERPEDVPPLVRHFVDRLSGGRELDVPAELMRRLQAMPWPGNVRELENTCERLVILARGDSLAEEDLPPEEPSTRSRASAGGGAFEGAATAQEDATTAQEGAPPAQVTPHPWPPLPPDGLSLVELERDVILRVLERHAWNVSQAARYLKVPRHILTYRLEKHGLRRCNHRRLPACAPKIGS